MVYGALDGNHCALHLGCLKCLHLNNMQILNRYFSCFLILIIINLCSCDFSDNKLKIWNNSKDFIAFIIPAEPDYFPTTDSDNTLSESKNDSLLRTRAKYDPKEESFGGVHFLASDSKKNLMTFNTTWEGVIRRTHKKNWTFTFFLLL